MSLDLSVEFCGLKLQNPVVVAPAGITGTADRIQRCEEAGAGAAVMKSYFELEVARKLPNPAFRLLRHRLGPLQSFTLYSYEQASPYDLQRYGEELSRAVRACDIPVMASVLGVSEQGWTEALRVCDQAGASAIEINVSCPHGPYTLGEGDFLSAAADILALGRSVTSLPLIPKLTPQLTDPIQAARVLAQAGGSAVVMFNRFTGLDIDLDTLRPVMHGGYAGHGGPWALHYVLRWIAAAYPQLDLPIAASGGVSRGSDVAKAILAGATVVQSCTAIVLEGYPVITRLIQGLEEFMERHGFSTLADFRGVVCDRVLTAEEVDRTASRRATIDETRCTACGRCRQACIYEAVAGDEKYTVLPDRCSGCGLCVEICPVNCMALVPRASR